MKKLSTRQLIYAVLIIDLLIFAALLFLRPDRRKAPAESQISEFNIKRICELATLDCFYHNVSEWSKPGNFIGYGAKKFWIEYDGIVRVGVRADQIKISEPDKDGVVTVTMPEAVILDKDLDEESLYEIDSSSPMWGFIPIYSSVSTEERKSALADAQEDMAKSASENSMILAEARERAKKIIEQNIVAVGAASGKEYKVRFSDESALNTETAAPVMTPTNVP